MLYITRHLCNKNKTNQRPELALRYSSAENPVEEDITGCDALIDQRIEPMNNKKQLVFDQS